MRIWREKKGLRRNTCWKQPFTDQLRNFGDNKREWEKSRSEEKGGAREREGKRKEKENQKKWEERGRREERGRKSSRKDGKDEGAEKVEERK